MKIKRAARQPAEDSAFSAVQVEAEMNCRACQYRVEKALKGLDGVRTFGVDLRRGLVAVWLDEKVVSEAAVRCSLSRR